VDAIYDGDVEAALAPVDQTLTNVLAGELRAIAVLDDERSEDLPNVPTAKELSHDVEVPVFGGIAAPAGTRAARRRNFSLIPRGSLGIKHDLCIAMAEEGA